MFIKRLLPVFALGLGLTLALLWLLETTLAVAAPSANLTVTKFTDSADGACDSDCSLREAIIAANENGQANTIALGSGTYVLSLTSGGAEPERDDLNIMSSYALTITGNGPQNTLIDANGIDRAIYINDGVPTVVISGVTIYGGASGSAGGGIYNRGGDLILINVAVVSNTTTSGGGGISLTGSDAVITLDEDCLIAGNEAGYDGGGLSVSYGARALLGGGRIVSNTALLGGGVYAYQGNITMSGVQISGNAANLKGGGVFIQSSTATLNGGAILSNTAGADGGGLLIGGAFTQTGQSVIGHNTAYTRGGGIYVEVGTVVLNDGQIIHNKVTDVGGNNWYGGGGVYVAGHAALIQTGSHTIVANSAAMHGGGVFVDGGRATMSGGQILNNTAGKNGGGVYLYSGGAFTQTAGLIAHNAAKGTDTSDGGGGIYSRYKNSLRLSGGQVLENQANRGGGLYVQSGSFDLLGAEIVGNHADLFGGGVHAGYLGWSTLLEGGRIISNTAGYGGGLYAIAGSVTLERGQIVGNHANSEGGGVYHDTGGSTFYVLTIINTTISGNTASDDGSALVNASGTTVLTYTTVASNPTTLAGHGIQKDGGAILAKNTLIAYNGDANCAEGAVTSNDHNLDSDASCGFAAPHDQSGVDPQLAPLAQDLGTLVHAIASGSPAHDAGACQVGIPIDQRNAPRLAPCDVGAYEYGEFHTLMVATDGTGVGTVEPSVGAHIYLSGTVVPITAAAGFNSTFEGWSGDLDGITNPTSITMDGNKAITATFVLTDYMIYLPFVAQNK